MALRPVMRCQFDLIYKDLQLCNNLTPEEQVFVKAYEDIYGKEKI